MFLLGVIYLKDTSLFITKYRLLCHPSMIIMVNSREPHIGNSARELYIAETSCLQKRRGTVIHSYLDQVTTHSPKNAKRLRPKCFSKFDV